MTQASGDVDTWQVRVHDLIARGVAEARREKHWTQEELARAFRARGLTAWRTSTVGSLEAGLRRPRLDEVLLMCRALEVTLDELIWGEDEHVQMGASAVMTPRGIRELLAGGFQRLYEQPADEAPYEWFPEDDAIAQAVDRSRAERSRLEPLLEPIVKWCDAHDRRLMMGEWRAAFRSPTDAERHAARKLGVEPAQVRLASRVLWRRDFADERDFRVGETEDMELRSLQARRGLVTRTLIGELQGFLTEVYGPDGSSAQ
jgi:transcriptional regulator with XRE-family HTH domain